MFYFMFGCIYPDMCIAYNITSSDRYLTRIIQSLYYSPASLCINAWMHSLKKSVKPEIVNRYDLWVLRHTIGGAKVFVNNVQWSDQMM
jgi:hypothetical protein